MKRRIIFVCFLFFIIIFFIIKISAVTGEVVTGETVTGEISAQLTNVSVRVIAPLSTLSIISPENATYLKNISLLLNYTVTGAQAVWYNVNGSNITITGITSTYFNTSEGGNILYLYANNSDNNLTMTNVSFVVNLTLFRILYSEYNGSLRGISTDFITYTYEDLQSLSNIILENTADGKILFKETINTTADANFSDNLLDLDTYTNISRNRIELNSIALPNFNKSATLWLYNLSFSNPRILKDGSICPTTICIEESYSSWILKFNVTNFNGNCVYTAEETPSEAEPTPPLGGGGGGGSLITKKTTFAVEPEIIKVMIKKGDSYNVILKIKNTENSTQEFNIETLGLENFMSISESNFLLRKQEEKQILVTFSSPKEVAEGTYTGTIKISTDKSEKEVPAILGIKSVITLFDIKLDIPSEYKELRPGEDLLFQVTLFDLGGIGRSDVELTYYIKDLFNNVIIQQEETVTVEGQSSFSRTIKLPYNMGNGQYVVVADAKYDSSIGTASDIFYIKRFKWEYFLVMLLSFIAIIILLILFFRKKFKKVSENYQQELNRIKSRIKEGYVKSIEAARMSERLKIHLSLLEKAYERGYITKKAYEDGKRRIKDVEQNIRKKYL